MHLMYDPTTGIIRRSDGELVPTYGNGAGYLYMWHEGQRRAVHRVAWFLSHGRWPLEIDHANGDRSDNRLENLREATRSLNEANKPRRRDNTSGFKGASWHKCRRRWRATITVRGKQMSLGYHDTPELAHAAYAEAARQHFGEFARPA